MHPQSKSRVGEAPFYGTSSGGVLAYPILQLIAKSQLSLLQPATIFHPGS
jgi:surfactin synthase thioesterase subunit